MFSFSVSTRTFVLSISALFLGFVLVALAWMASSGVVRAQDPPPTYLPIVLTAPTGPAGLSGLITQNGVPAPNIPVHIVDFFRAGYTVVLTTTTNAQGEYFFPTDTLDIDYWVSRSLTVFGAEAPDPETRALRCASSPLPESFFPPTQAQRMPTFDIAAISVDAPGDGITTTLPVSFTWTPVPSAFNVSYSLDLRMPAIIVIGNPAGFAINVGSASQFVLQESDIPDDRVYENLVKWSVIPEFGAQNRVRCTQRTRDIQFVQP